MHCIDQMNVNIFTSTNPTNPNSILFLTFIIITFVEFIALYMWFKSYICGVETVILGNSKYQKETGDSKLSKVYRLFIILEMYTRF